MKVTGNDFQTGNEGETILSFLRKATEQYPHKVALTYMGKNLTYARLNELIDRFACALNELGVRKGDRVVIYLPNSPQFVIAFFGIMKVGAVSVPISPIYTPEEIEYMTRDSEADTIAVSYTHLTLPTN